ncbi:GTP cyclohydrolase, FolE2/MptA family, partial [Xanthomonas oryzae]
MRESTTTSLRFLVAFEPRSSPLPSDEYPMSATLPDVAVTEAFTLSAPLRWVGMQDIAIPVHLDAVSGSGLAARASVQVDLPRAELKGIHMSRLYRLLDLHLQRPLSPA